jgi:2-hydroxychromene-2-carboxylate isomerase
MQAQWYFDFISPFAYLQLRKVLAWRERLQIVPVPVAFGAILKHHGNVGPAEVPGKREWTYRFVQWQAEQSGVPLRFPPAHPFNPLAALRLCIAAGTTWRAVQTIYDHLWARGQAGTTSAQLADAGRALGIDNVENATNAPEVKTQLRTNTDAAIAAGVFGVPTLRVGSELFWGNDASPMIEQWLDDPQRFSGAEYRRIETLPVGVERARG